MLDLGVRPRALRAQSAAQVRAFEETFELVGVKLLLLACTAALAVHARLRSGGTDPAGRPGLSGAPGHNTPPGTVPRMAWARPIRVIEQLPAGCRRACSTSRNLETSSSPIVARV